MSCCQLSESVPLYDFSCIDNRDKIEVITKMVSQSNIEEKNENSQEKAPETDKEAIKLVDSIEENKSV